MNRRTAIQHVIILGAGTTLLASCQDKATIATKNIPLTGSQEDLLSALTETIIPTTDFVGAKELQSHKFVLLMADDCAGPEDQKKFINVLQTFDVLCKKKYSNKFVKCAPQQREEFLLTIEAKTDIPEEVVEFYQAIKQLTIQSFTTSEAYLTRQGFSLVPGKYNGCAPIAAA
jgi:hypothetical protein